MTKLRLLAAVGLLTAVIAIPLAHAAGLWWGLPLIGGASYCVSYSGYSTTTTVPGVNSTPNNCNGTAPAGPALFTGNEVVPVDIYGPAAGVTNTAPSSAYMSVTQLGNGAYVDLTTVTTGTIPANTSFYFIDGAQSGNYTITLPPNPIEGQIVKIVCEHATSGALNVAANTGSTLVASGNPSTACVVFNTYSYRYIAATTTWYRY